VIRQPTCEWVCPESPITPSIASLSCAWNLAWACQLKHQSGSLASVLGIKRDYTQDPGGTVTRQKLACGKARDSRVTGNPNRSVRRRIGTEKRASSERSIAGEKPTSHY